MGCIFGSGKTKDGNKKLKLKIVENICPKCSEIPTLIEIHSDNEKMFLKCNCQKGNNNQNISVDVTLKEFYDILAEKNGITNENNNTDNDIDNDLDNDIDNDNKNGLENDITEIIREKNRNISRMIKTYQIILNTFENNQNNYFHAKSVINLADSIMREKQRDTTDIGWAMKLLKEKREAHNKALYKLKNDYNVDINADNERICLFPDVKIGDDGFLQFSKILFTQLKEIDLADNNISDISHIKDMILPNLEYLDLSYNQITNIKEIAELDCEEMKEICLQDNDIETIKYFINSNFPKLELLRIENNKRIKKDKSENKEVLQKFDGKIIHEVKTSREFDKKYGTAICSELKDKKKN